MFSRETFSLSDSLAGTTVGVFTAFPLNSFRGEVDGWLGMGQESSEHCEEANGSLCYL